MEIPEKPALWAKRYKEIEKEELYSFIKGTFSQKLSKDFLEKVDIVDFLISYLDDLGRQKEHDKIIKLIDLIYKYNKNSLEKRDYQYIDGYILDIKLFKSELDITDFANLLATPVESIDKLIKYLKKSIYYGYNEIAFNIATEVYATVKESPELIPGAETDFSSAIFLNKWQNHYENIKKGSDIDKEELISFLEKYDYHMAEHYDDILGYLTLEDRYSEDYNQEFLEKHRRFLTKTSWIFTRYMYENKNFTFQISDSIWEESLSCLLKNKTLEELVWLNDLFMIDRLEFMAYLKNMTSFLSDNYEDLFLLLWGIVYLYDFLYDQGIISEIVYKSALKIFEWARQEVLLAYSSILWKNSFVVRWPKPDSTEQELFNKEKELFISSFYNKEIDSNYFSKKVQENYIIQENVKKSKKYGRNDPCPCGSGKKYKKCCLRKMESQEIKWKNNEEKSRNLCWTIEEIEKMTTEQIIDKLFYFGVYFNQDVFMEKFKDASIDNIVDEWFDKFDVRARYFDRDYIKLAAIVLSKRFAE